MKIQLVKKATVHYLSLSGYGKSTYQSSAVYMSFPEYKELSS